MSAAGDPTEDDVRHKATQESECVGYHLIIVDSMFATIRLQYHSSLYYAIFGSEIHNVERVSTNNTITCISLNMILITIDNSVILNCSGEGPFVLIFCKT